MKPNNKALGEALSVTQIPEEDMREYMRRVLTAAYAAQFQGEEYAGLIKRLRDWGAMNYKECDEAADAIEALLARLAPVEDDKLVAILAKHIIDATSDMPPRTTYSISESGYVGARAAIAAIRPHIEAAERERSSEFIGLFLELLGALKKVVATHHQCINLTPETISKFEDLASQAEAIAAAIRSGK